MQQDEIYVRLGALIKRRRTYMQLTQEELAEKVGFSRASIANIESGRQKVLVHQIYQFSKFLNLSPTDLLPAVSAPEGIVMPENSTRSDQMWVHSIFRRVENA